MADARALRGPEAVGPAVVPARLAAGVTPRVVDGAGFRTDGVVDEPVELAP